MQLVVTGSPLCTSSDRVMQLINNHKNPSPWTSPPRLAEQPLGSFGWLPKYSKVSGAFSINRKWCPTLVLNTCTCYSLPAPADLTHLTCFPSGCYAHLAHITYGKMLLI